MIRATAIGGILGLACWAVAARPGLADEIPPLLPPTVDVARGEAGLRIDVVPHGVIIDHALPKDVQRRRELWLLTVEAPESDSLTPAVGAVEASDDPPIVPPLPCVDRNRLTERARLLRVTLFDDEGNLTPRAQVWTEAIAARGVDAVDLDGDGADELLLIDGGRLRRVDRSVQTAAAVELLHDEAAIGEPIFFRPSDGGPLWVRYAAVGSGRYFRYEIPSGRFVPALEVELSTGVGQLPGRLVLSSPAMRYIGRDSLERPTFASRPMVLGRRRVRVELVRPLADDDEQRRSECWGRLPEDENPVERFVKMLDGEPVAIVTTTPAGGLNLFGEKRLRIFPLRRDRSRSGVAPSFEIETRVNLWQSIHPVFRDLNDDGRTDMVLTYWKGLKDDRIVLDTYLRREDGEFARRPRSQGFDVELGDRGFSLYGADVDGDRIPDLVLSGERSLLLFAGVPKVGARVARTPAARIPLGDGCDEPQSADAEISIGDDGATSSPSPVGPGVPIEVDLDGNGRTEFIVSGPGCCGAPFRIFLFDPVADAP